MKIQGLKGDQGTKTQGTKIIKGLRLLTPGLGQGLTTSSIINVVRHLKYFIQNVYGDNFLTLQYKIAKPNQETKGNTKFQQILKNSYQEPLVMNANRQMKKKEYVHLKSMTYPHEFQFFKQNIRTFSKVKSLQIDQSNKVDLYTPPQKITFDSQTKKWIFRNKRVLFKPSYQTVLNGKLFRISLYSQHKGFKEPKRKVRQVLEEAIDKALISEKLNSKVLKPSQKFKQDEKIVETTNLYYKGQKTQKAQQLKDTKINIQAPQDLRINKV